MDLRAAGASCAGKMGCAGCASAACPDGPLAGTNPMTIDQAEERVAAILAARERPAESHVLDDDLRDDFIQAIVHGGIKPDDIQPIACVLLRTNSFGMERWYA